MKGRRTLVGMAVVLLLVAGLIVPVGAEMTPPTLTATLTSRASISETKTVTIPEVPPRADVVFAFDLTGSMGGIISTAKSQAVNILSALDALPDVDIQYGVMSYMDYPSVYSSCGYYTSYGNSGCGDYAYSLDQAVTDGTTSITTAISGLTLGCGDDGPQDYTRIMYESYADPDVSWRSGARRILVNFGDNVPHDCDLNEGVTSGTWTTGSDPGRDEIMGTADDLDLQTVLANMATNGVILLECHTTDYANEYWSYWTGITGGDVYITGSSTLVDDVIEAVEVALEVPVVDGLHLEASTGYESWLTMVDPASYDGLEPGDVVDFDITITVPDGTADGIYNFTISALDDVGVSYGDQDVTITVINIVPVSIDIKPQSCPNPIGTKDKGALPIAILGTADFDVTMIDPASVELEGVSSLRWALEDVAAPYGPLPAEPDAYACTTEGADGYMDLTLKFKMQEIVAALGEVNDGDVLVLQLTGNLKEEYGGTPIVGADVVWIVKK